MTPRCLSKWGAALLLCLLLDVANAEEWTQAALLAALSQQVRPVLQFVEVRHLAYLDVPLQSRGELEFRPPDYLRRTVSNGASFEIQSDRLSLREAGGLRRDISLDSYPGLRAYAESFRATLSGNLPQLQRYFHSELRGERWRWELRLLPKETTIAGVIARISLFGSGGQIERVETYERGGDYTVTHLEFRP